MADPAVLLHVGAMKTGTTYVQNLLKANRKPLKKQGWLVPPGPLVTTGVREVMGLTDAGPKAATRGTPKWDKVVRQCTEWDGVGSLVSMEFLSYAGPDRARRVVESFGQDRVHVVLTVRDAAGALPSQWQSWSRNGGEYSWPDFAREITRSGSKKRSPAVRTFHRTQNIPRMLETWGALVPASRLTVVTVPGRGAPRDELWNRFCHAAGVDSESTVVDESAFGNPQLGYGSVELLRRINAAGLVRLRPSAYRKVVRYVARNHLIALRDSESRPGLDRETAEFAADLNRRTLAAIREHGVLIGQPHELPTDVDTSDLPEIPADVPEEEVLAAAEAARLGMLQWFADHATAPPGDLAEPAPGVEAAVARLAAAMEEAANRS